MVSRGTQTEMEEDVKILQFLKARGIDTLEKLKYVFDKFQDKIKVPVDEDHEDVIFVNEELPPPTEHTKKCVSVISNEKLNILLEASAQNKKIINIFAKNDLYKSVIEQSLKKNNQKSEQLQTETSKYETNQSLHSQELASDTSNKQVDNLESQQDTSLQSQDVEVHAGTEDDPGQWMMNACHPTIGSIDSMPMRYRSACCQRKYSRGVHHRHPRSQQNHRDYRNDQSRHGYNQHNNNVVPTQCVYMNTYDNVVGPNTHDGYHGASGFTNCHNIPFTTPIMQHLTSTNVSKTIYQQQQRPVPSMANATGRSVYNIAQYTLTRPKSSIPGPIP